MGEIGYCIVAVDFRGKKTFIKVRCVEHFCSAARRDFYDFVLLKKVFFIDWVNKNIRVVPPVYSSFGFGWTQHDQKGYRGRRLGSLLPRRSWSLDRYGSGRSQSYRPCWGWRSPQDYESIMQVMRFNTWDLDSIFFEKASIIKFTRTWSHFQCLGYNPRWWRRPAASRKTFHQGVPRAPSMLQLAMLVRYLSVSLPR